MCHSSVAFGPIRPVTILSKLFFFNDTATTEIYTLSLHDALPIYPLHLGKHDLWIRIRVLGPGHQPGRDEEDRSEEHTSELQSPDHIVCRLLLEKKNSLQRRTCCQLPLYCF